jgi:hypothetical protein
MKAFYIKSNFNRIVKILSLPVKIIINREFFSKIQVQKRKVDKSLRILFWIYKC